MVKSQCFLWGKTEEATGFSASPGRRVASQVWCEKRLGELLDELAKEPRVMEVESREMVMLGLGLRMQVPMGKESW